MAIGETMTFQKKIKMLFFAKRTGEVVYNQQNASKKCKNEPENELKTEKCGLGKRLRMNNFPFFPEKRSGTNRKNEPEHAGFSNFKIECRRLSKAQSLRPNANAA
jgi:hypothetical protein